MIKNREQFATICLVGLVIILFGSYTFLDHKKSLTYEDFFRAIPTIIIGLITAYIGWQQHQVAAAQKQIAEDKHRLELFEKRYAVYEATLATGLCGVSIEYYDPNKTLKTDENTEEQLTKELKKLISLTEKARFLFDNNVYEQISENTNNISKLRRKVIIVNEYYSKENQTFTNKLIIDGLLKEIDTINDDIIKFLEKILPELMEPYLKTAPYTFY